MVEEEENEEEQMKRKHQELLKRLGAIADVDVEEEPKKEEEVKQKIEEKSNPFKEGIESKEKIIKLAK